jgi:hypothetical protein
MAKNIFELNANGNERYMKEGHAKHAPFAYVYKFYYVFLLIFFPLSFLVSVSSHKVF